MIKKFLLLSLLSVCFSSLSIASEKHYFKDDTTLQIKVSRNNLNRLFVRGDKITELKFPSGSLVLSGGQKGSTDNSGSLYFSAMNTRPVTAYLATESGHHLALVVSTLEGNGKTLELIPRLASSQATHWEHTKPYEDALMKMMSALQSKNTPAGFGEERPTARRIFIKNKGFTQAKKIINGQHLQGSVIYFKNTTHHGVVLNEQDFGRKGVRSVMLSSHRVAPHQGAWVYLVADNKERA